MNKVNIASRTSRRRATFHTFDEYKALLSKPPLPGESLLDVYLRAYPPEIKIEAKQICYQLSSTAGIADPENGHFAQISALFAYQEANAEAMTVVGVMLKDSIAALDKRLSEFDKLSNELCKTIEKRFEDKSIIFVDLLIKQVHIALGLAVDSLNFKGIPWIQKVILLFSDLTFWSLVLYFCTGSIGITLLISR